MFLKLLRNLLIGLFFIPLFLYGQVGFVSVCDRTPQVRDTIMKKIVRIDPGIECDDEDLTPLLLSEIKILNLHGKRITSLKAGDFSGLSALTYLSLSYNNLSSLVPDTFSGLFALTHLDLYNNRIGSLVPGTFSGLDSLTRLQLDRNNIESLPDIFFSNLRSLQTLEIRSNPLDEQTKSRLRTFFQRDGRSEDNLSL